MTTDPAPRHGHGTGTRAGASAALHLAIARRGFRRYATYRLATLGGLVTNCIFGAIRASVLIAVWTTRSRIGAYDLTDAVTFAFVSQALLLPLDVFRGLELSERVRSGDIVVDLHRPVGLQRWWLTIDMGRMTYQLLARAVPILAVGFAFFRLRPPGSLVACIAVVVSIVLGVLVSFGQRYLVALSAFWLLDDRGVSSAASLATMLLSGMLLPLVLFPDWLQSTARLLPWSAMVQVPVDVYLGHDGGVELLLALGFQALWAAVLLLVGAAVTQRALRRLVVQGG